MHVVTVLFVIKQEYIHEFVEAVQSNAAVSLRTEAGCKRFDVCIAPSLPGRIFLYELYDDKNAFAAHLASEHYLAFASGTSGWVASKNVQEFQLLM